MKMDPATGQSRGFGFILFHNEASIEAVLAAGNHEIDGKTVSYSILIDLDRGVGGQTVGCLLLIIFIILGCLLSIISGRSEKSRTTRR